MNQADAKPVAAFFGPEALLELEVVKTAMSKEGMAPWALLRSIDGRGGYFEVVSIGPAPEDADFTELLITDPEMGSEAIRPPNHGLYDHSDLSIARYEAEEKTWWRLRECADQGYFDVLIFIVAKGEDPCAFFRSSEVAQPDWTEQDRANTRAEYIAKCPERPCDDKWAFGLRACEECWQMRIAFGPQ